jgi:hypothetical protein
MYWILTRKTGLCKPKNNCKMKRITRYIYIGLLTAVLSCSKSLTENNLSFPPLAPEEIDLDAGTWLPVLLTGPTEFAVAAPGTTTTPAFAAELNEIKSWQRQLSSSHREKINYWSAGAVLRWNEILRQLVSIHNLPPYQNTDSTYPAPNANNPFAYPQFPFANPPYASRAYAYVSAAMYDALVAAHHYKKLYNRSAPYKLDTTVQALVPRSDLPSYPSEDAVVAGVAVEMMKLLFPTDLAFVQQKADEHMLSRIMAGANVRSDIEAGLALGRLVAQKFTTRARGDRAGAAGGNAALWKQLETDCIARGEDPWISQELPKRPPMLPVFGKVKTWLFDSLTAVSLRPGPPPSTSSEEFKEELDEVLYYSENYDRERLRIVHFWADGINTPTPPGHWNTIAAESFVKQNWSEVRWARNLALLNMAMADGATCCWDAKFTYFNPRPSQVNPKIKTWTGLPNFPAYVSGHSTFSSAAARFLGHILPGEAQKFEDMAEEASLSRLYGCIHYRSDIEKGAELGNNIGQYAINRATTDGADQ